MIERQPPPTELEPLPVAILNSLPEGVWFADLQGIIRFWSKRAEAITGFPVNDVVGKPFDSVLSYCGETGEPVSMAPMRATPGDGEQHAHLFLLHKMGHRVAVEVQTATVRSAAGVVIGALEILYESKEGAALTTRGRVLDQHGLWDGKSESSSKEYMLEQLKLRLDQFQRNAIPTGALVIHVDHLGIKTGIWVTRRGTRYWRW